MKTSMHQNSIDAYATVNLTARQRDVYNALRILGEATDQRLADYLKWPINRITGRLTELRDAGIIIECGNVIGEYGKTVRVCRLAPKNGELF